jgi:polysaccharide pyruvyl transferase WcaK-like protein
MDRRGQTFAAPEGLGVDEMARLVQSCDLVVGMRMHSIVLATLSGVPSVALDYDPKVAELMKRIGRGDFCLDMSVGRDPLMDRMARSYVTRSRASQLSRSLQAPGWRRRTSIRQ